MAFSSRFWSFLYQDDSGNIGKKKRGRCGLVNTKQVGDLMIPQIILLLDDQFGVFGIQCWHDILHV